MNSTTALQLDALLQALVEHPAESAAGRALRNAVPDVDLARRWLREQARRDLRPIVFRWTGPGYVEIGLEGEERIYREPDAKGLDLAHAILMHGVVASSVLRFDDTANAVRNMLARAATWVDPKCTELANAIRAITIRNVPEGVAPHFNPARPTKLILG